MVVRRIALLFACLTLATAAHAQALPSATSSGLSYQVGGGVSFGQPDYSDDVIKGVSVFANMDLLGGLGLDLEYHNLDLVTPQDIGESSLVGGVRYGHKVKAHYYPYIKAVVGLGTITFQQGTYVTTTSMSYGMYAVGGGLEYRTNGHLMIRAVDFEFQNWANFPPNGINPYIITIGAGTAGTRSRATGLQTQLTCRSGESQLWFAAFVCLIRGNRCLLYEFQGDVVLCSCGTAVLKLRCGVPYLARKAAQFDADGAIGRGDGRVGAVEPPGEGPDESVPPAWTFRAAAAPSWLSIERGRTGW